MCTIFYNFRKKCEDDIAASISLPANFFTVTPESFRASYVISYPDQLPVIQYITKLKGENGAKYLCKKGIVSGYKRSDKGEIILLHECFIDGERQPDIVLPWNKVGKYVTASDVKRWAVQAEYRRCRKGKPLTGARLASVLVMHPASSINTLQIA